MESSYHLPPDIEELDSGFLGSEGGLAWSDDQVHAWTSPGTWTRLSDPPSSIEESYRASGGVLLETEDGALGFWALGAEEWSWWEGESELPFSNAYPPIGGRLVAEDQRGFNGLRLLVYCLTSNGMERETTVNEIPDPTEDSGFAFVHEVSEDASASAEPVPRLILLLGETLHWRSLSGEDGSFRTHNLSLEEEVRWFTDGFPPTIGGLLSGSRLLSGLPPQVCGNTLFLHRGSFDLKTTLEVDLEDGSVSATGLAPLSRSRAPWQAYADGRPGEIETFLNALDALPAPPEDHLAETVELIDVAVQEDGTVQAALTDCGIYAADGTCSVGSSDNLGSTDSEGGVQSDAPLSWRLWFGEKKAERDLYRKVANETDGQEVGVETLQVHVGADACARFFEELRSDDPPQSVTGDLDYNGETIRALFGPYGPDVADLVEAGLTDNYAAVRVAACIAAGARGGNHYSGSLYFLNRKPVPDSLLWPDRKALPREALWENLSHQTPEVRAAAAETCGFLRLAGSGDSLRPLLHDTPLLGSDTENVREMALEALRLIPEIPDSTTEDIENCVRSDPSPTIRQTAVRTLDSHCRGASSLDALIWALGDTAYKVGENMSDALIGHATALTPKQYRGLVNRWLLRYLGHRRGSGTITFENSFPDQLLGSILAQRLIPGDVRELRPESAEQLTLEDLNITEETLQMAPTALSISSVQTALFEETPLASSSEESSAAHNGAAEFERALKEHLAEKTFLDEIDDSTFNYESPAMQAAELTAAIYEHDPHLGRRLSALVLSELGLPSEETGGDAGGYRPLHTRLRDFSSESPHEKCHRYVQQLAEGDGAGGVLGRYVLAAEGDEKAEASLIDQLTAGRLNDVPIALPLLQKTSPFSTRPDAFAEESLLGPYFASEGIPIARRIEAFHNHYDSVGIVETDHIPRDQWVPFLDEYAGCSELLSWNDRHRAALNLARLGDQRGRPADLWAEKVDSINEVPDNEVSDYVRDRLWAGDDALWTEFWSRWPDEYWNWALYMLADRGDADAASRIEAALEDEAVPQQLATETIQEIRGRENP